MKKEVQKGIYKLKFLNPKFFKIKVFLTEFLAALIAIILAAEIFIFETRFTKTLACVVFILFCFFSYILIESMGKEVKRRKETEKLSSELRKANKSIKVLSSIKTEFLKVVNHQLRTPVSIIKGMVSMLAEGSVKGRQKKDFIKKLYLSSERLTGILDDILVTQGLIGGAEVVKPVPSQIEDIVEVQVKRLRPFAENKRLKIKFKKPKKPIPMTFIDPEMISRAVGRVIDNAILYSEKGEIKVKVRLKEKRGKDFIEITVKDSGIGLSKADKKNVFKVFYRGEKATSLHPNASGLGLFIVKNFIEIHEGKIEAESKGRGKGSKFIITLPVVQEL
jgi:signal transduction histidine kinase